MQLRDQLKADAMAALKAHDNRKSQALRYLVSLIDKRSLQLPEGQMNEVEVLAVMQKEMKNKQESKAIFAQAGRSELVEDTDYEIELLAGYLPAAVTDEEVKQATVEVVAKVGPNFGLVMKEVMGRFKGRVEGNVVSRIVKEVIG